MSSSRTPLPPSQYRRLVVKVGSAVLSGPEGRKHQLEIAAQVSALRAEGREVVLVSSGAQAVGMEKLGLREKPKTMPGKQALAAVGQPALMQLWEQAFSWYGLRVAQVLLTAEDLGHRHRYLNARQTLETLLSWGILPIINENDTVMVEEIKFGDNDQLSALIATLVGADLLVLLSDIEALYEADPRQHPGARAIPYVERVDQEVLRMAGESPNRVGTGGMRSKLLAAQKAQAAGIPTLLLPGTRPESIPQALRGEGVGTFFAGGQRRYSGRKLWLYQLPKPRGEVVVDAGAARALQQEGASLLPAGILEVRGQFGVGEPVRCLDAEGSLIGVGLVNYSAAELRRIKGKKTKDIEALLGYKNTDEAIHRDYFALVSELGGK
ncbi:Glutamate 5-kinase [Meiothermus luteus]|uniref:Glutamate 5-kinase n=1 Tax=Meiothermus luteus TaxID=2026184 RepID=A0A399EVM3_9DEIN|nr:glutamate 5-kinase [Meiothermus luteus]RIH87713.1 Glutamate 5-kinase [Meiothermus luteus]RMH53702.1 MAG: glutamate 5-kinase [Deinococcota bacterium]